jgi:hypothetical protein
LGWCCDRAYPPDRLDASRAGEVRGEKYEGEGFVLCDPFTPGVVTGREELLLGFVPDTNGELLAAATASAVACS